MPSHYKYNYGTSQQELEAHKAWVEEIWGTPPVSDRANAVERCVVGASLL